MSLHVDVNDVMSLNEGAFVIEKKNCHGIFYSKNKCYGTFKEIPIISIITCPVMPFKK